jgi:predicted DNA-binding protein with PD1-like motif
MTGLQRWVQQPGMAPEMRASIIPVATTPIAQTLPAGLRLLDAVAVLLENGRHESACLSLSGGAFGPFAYVMPASSPDTAHAAYYSATFRPPGDTRLIEGRMTLGRRAGQPFFHCHALWTHADGTLGCGHILPDETVISAPIDLGGTGVIGACFNVVADPETGFSLFKPQATGTAMPVDACPGLAIRLAPNQDLTRALESAGSRLPVAQAVVRGGVASLIGARFIDAPQLDGFATEMFVRSGRIACAPDAAGASEIDITIVDLHGNIRSGRLLRGDNPVLMTFEGLLEAA